MSIVRYTNKKTGVVSLYESTSYYDPVLKQSRPKRKYLGTEDPETGELIPSSGRKGRKKKDGLDPASNTQKAETVLREKYDRLLVECNEKTSRIKQLEQDNRKLRFCLQRLRDAADAMIKDEGVQE